MKIAVFCPNWVGDLVMATSALRGLRRTVDDLRRETVGMIGEMRVAVRDAGYEVERVDALLSTAESVGENLDSASRLVRRTVQNPVVQRRLTKSVRSEAPRIRPPPIAPGTH